MEGRVVGDKTNKTVTVLVERRIMDPVYKKFIRRSKKYAAHDESNVFRIGDYVSIEECAPISKSKRWTVISAQPTDKRDDKAVIQALAARAIAEQNKPEAKKKAPKAAAAPKAPKAAKPEAAGDAAPKKAPAKAKAPAAAKVKKDEQ
jgi:small subunit ribosomal protein S17